MPSSYSSFYFKDVKDLDVLRAILNFQETFTLEHKIKQVTQKYIELYGNEKISKDKLSLLVDNLIEEKTITVYYWRSMELLAIEINLQKELDEKLTDMGYYYYSFDGDKELNSILENTVEKIPQFNSIKEELSSENQLDKINISDITTKIEENIDLLSLMYKGNEDIRVLDIHEYFYNDKKEIMLGILN